MNYTLSSKEIIDLQNNYIKNYHSDPVTEISEPSSEILKAVLANAFSNNKLWHLEDDARMEDVPDAQTADIKHKIDKTNQERNDRIEKIDELLVGILPVLSDDEKERLPINSETPGSIIDRLCIGNLKIFHMNEETQRTDASQEHIKKCENKLHVLNLQKQDLATSFDILLDDLLKRRKQLKIYRQFKMYNDPNLNPSLYKKNQD